MQSKTERINSICPICKKKYAVTEYKSRFQKTCGKKCGYALMRERSRVTKKCAVCQKYFNVYRVVAHERKACSPECGAKLRRTATPVPCKQCGKIFYVKPARLGAGRGKYCSRECYEESMTQRITKKCEYCGKTIRFLPRLKDRKRYCSWECRRGPKIIKTCPICKRKVRIKPYQVPTWRVCSKKCSGPYFRKQYLGRKMQPFTLEHRRRIGKAKLGFRHSSETVEKMRKRMTGNKINVGRKASPETRLKLSKLWQGRKLTPEWKIHIREGQKVFRKEHPERWAERQRKAMAHPSGLERVVQDWLKQLGYQEGRDFKCNVWFHDLYGEADIVMEPLKLVIEVQGPHHYEPKMFGKHRDRFIHRIRKDKEKRDYWKRNGYGVFYLHYTDIRGRPERGKFKLKRAILLQKIKHSLTF